MSDKKRRNKRAYLEAFQKNDNGEYVYTGKLFYWQQEEGKKRRELWLLRALSFAVFSLTAAACCVRAPGTAHCAYVIIPCTAGFLLSISICVGMYRLGKGGPLRDYDYQAGVQKLPLRAACTWAASASAALGEIVFVFKNGMEEKTGGFILFLLLEGAAAAAAFEIRRRIKKMDWSNSRPL